MMAGGIGMTGAAEQLQQRWKALDCQQGGKKQKTKTWINPCLDTNAKPVTNETKITMTHKQK